MSAESVSLIFDTLGKVSAIHIDFLLYMRHTQDSYILYDMCENSEQTADMVLHVPV